MTNKEINEDVIQGLVGLIGFAIILPLVYFDVIDFFWTGIWVWIGLTFVGIAIIKQAEHLKINPEIIIKRFDGTDKEKNKARKPTKAELDDDFNLPEYGVTIWESSEGVQINFNYVDAYGNHTERSVIIHEMTKDSKTRFYFKGYCLLRKEMRTFNSENIQDIYDMNGEIIKVPDFINKLAGYNAYGTTIIRKK